VRNASRYEDECRVKEDAKDGSIVPSSPAATINTSPEDLTATFIDFLGRHGQTTNSAIHCLNSGSTAFSPVHQILRTPHNVRRIAKELAASDKPAACIRLLSLAITYDCHLNAPAYEGICWTLSRHKRFQLILEVFRLAKENLDSLTCRLLDWRLRALLELENYAAFRNVFQDYEEAHIRPSRRAWHIILAAQLRNRNVGASRQCLSSMEAAGLPINSATHVTIAENYRHLGLDRQVEDLALSILENLTPSKRVFVVNQLLESHLRCNDQSGLHQLFSFFDADIIGPVQRLLNLLDNFENPNVNSSAVRSPVSLLPNAQTFLIAIRLCMIRSDFVGAEHIFSLMARQGIELSPIILAAYMNLQFAVGKPSIAMYLMSQVLSSKDLDVLYDRLDERNDVQLDWKWPFSTFRIPPHIDVLNALLRGILDIRGLDGARIVLEQMRQVDIKPNSHSLKILIDYMVHFERTTPAAILRVLRQLFPIFRVSLRHLHPLISRILHVEKKRLYYSSMPKNTKMARRRLPENVDWSSDGPFAGVRLDRFLVRPSLARFLFASLESRGIRSDAAMLALRIRYDGVIKRDTEGAVDTYTDMLSRGIMPSVYHISALMEGFALRGETDMALKIMRAAKEYNVKPNLVMYTILLHGYGHQNQPKAAAELFEAMISSGIHPDVRAIYALCKTFILARRLGAAKKLLITLWPYIEPVPRKHPVTPLLELLKRFCQLDTSRPTSRRNLSRKKRALLQRQLTAVVKAYKRSSSLPEELISNSSRVRHLVKKSHYVNRKV
jgi:pentatricopeptide repeat protein